MFISVFPFLKSGYPKTHDNYLYPILTYEFHQGFSHGHFLPRWSADFWLGLGSPFFNFIQPLFFYLTEIFIFIGFNIITSLKIIIILSVFLNFISMFLLGRELWGNNVSGWLAASVYTFFPYRFAQLYFRGAYAEYLALALIPLVLFFFWRLAKTGEKKYFWLSSLFLGLLLLTHNVYSLLALPLIIAFLLFNYWSKLKKVYQKIILALIFGIALAAFFLGPAFLEKKYLYQEALIKDNFYFANNFLSLADLAVPTWGSYHYFQIGITSILIILLLIYLIWRKQQWEQKEKTIIIFFVLIFFGAIFLMLPASNFLWQNLPFLKYAQFPWRFLGFICLAVALISPVLLKDQVKKIFIKKSLTEHTWFIILILIILIVNIFYLKTLGYLPAEKDESYHPFNQTFSDVNILEENLEKLKKNIPIEVVFFNLHSILPTIVPKGTQLENFVEEIKQNIIRIKLTNDQTAENHLPKVQVISGELDWTAETNDPNKISLDLNAKKDSLIALNQFYFPGWTASLDGSQTEINHDNYLQITIFQIPVGQHNLVLEFKNTPIRTISNLISIISWLILLVLGGLLYFINRRNKKSPQPQP